jgi:hypothetical protein
MNALEELVAATAALPAEVRGAFSLALDCGEFTIGAGSWETELAVCPMTAAAITAGVWRADGIIAGAEEWGTPDGPSDSVEEFAAWFDICAEEHGLPEALAEVRAAASATRSGSSQDPADSGAPLLVCRAAR